MSSFSFVYWDEFVCMSDGPEGKPDLQPMRREEYEGEAVILTCFNPSDDGNPNCDMYTWSRVEGNPGDLPNTQVYTFTMDESHAGNYTCTCGNMYNVSEVSNTAEVILLTREPPPPSCKYNTQ